MIYKPLSFPSISHDSADIYDLFGPGSVRFQSVVQTILGAKRNYLGCDLEFQGKRFEEKPTILGLSDGFLSVSVPWEEGVDALRDLVEMHNPVFVGHAFVGADAGVFRNIGVNIDLLNIEDTIIWHWLVSANLCKGSGKTEDNDGEKRGKGWMNLWTFASLYTNLAGWKDHKGDGLCDVCPQCQIWEYNGLDSLSSLVGLPEVVKIARLRGVDSLYPMHRELLYVLSEMSKYGIQTNREYINNLQAELERDKERIGKTLPFAPTSPKQIIAYFKTKGINLPDVQETTVREFADSYNDADLVGLLEFKELGGGVDRWFGEKFMDMNNRVHPRLGPFTSTGRLQCVSPNLQNTAKRRVDRHVCVCGAKKEEHPTPTCLVFSGVSLGKRVRQAIIATPGWYLLKADFQNAENRVFLYLGGHTIPDGQDLHAWVAKTMELTPDMEFSVLNGSPREAAKTAQHGCITGDHEILTPQGWINISDWKDEQIAVWHESGAIQFETPIRFHRYEVENESMRRLLGCSLSTVCTTNHAFPVITRAKNYCKFERFLVDELPRSGAIKTTGILTEPPPTFSDEEVLRAVACQADGSLDSIRGRKTGWIKFHFVKPRKIERIRTLFGVEPHPCKCHKGGVRLAVKFSSSLLDDKKRFTDNLLKMTQQQRLLFLKEVLFWDGHDAPRRHELATRDAVSAKWVQTIAHLSGKRALFRNKRWRSGFTGEEGHIYVVAFGKGEHATIRQLVKEKFSYTGPVFCFTTSSGYFMVRHKDRIYVTGNSYYLEGIQLKTPQELRTATMKREIAAGVRIVYPNWTFRGKIVTFTGANLAERAFGDKSYANRLKAQQILERLFGRFPGARGLQKRIAQQVERDHMVSPPHRYKLLIYGPDEEQLKTAAAMWGSNPIAHLTKLALITLWREFLAGRPMRPVLQIHDEILCEVREDIPPEQAKKWLAAAMEIETPEIPGLIVPADAAYGVNWRDMKKC